jgi:ubiquinone biosynthesis protein
MFRSIAHSARLLRAVWGLARYDVLAPHEIDDVVPRGLKTIGRLSRLTQSRRLRNQPLEERLTQALGNLGPTYIKLGQLLATRGDVVGPEVAKALSVLQDRLPPFAMEEARQILERELNAPVESLFVSLSAPVAAASVAQVHRGVVHTQTETPEGPKTEEKAVAVKILRPHIQRIFQKELDAFAWGARQLERFYPASRRLEPVQLIKTLAASVRLEMDLRMEGAAASELAENTSGDTTFHVPEVDWRRTSKRVLTTAWVDGVGLGDTERLDRDGFDRAALGDLVVHTFLTQALRDGLFHADMHQGNLFARKEVDNNGKDQLGLLAVDFGIMGRLDIATRRYLAEILFGFMMRDYVRVARAHFEAGYVSHEYPLADFALALRAIGEPMYGQLADDISMARLLTQLFETTETFDMHLQPQLVLLQKTMVVVEGVARDLNPSLNMWEVARPAVEAFMSRTIGPEAWANDAVEGAATMARIMAHAPETLEKIERAANLVTEMTEDGGLKLHPETAKAIAEAQVARGRVGRTAIWIAAGALTVLAIGSL